MKTELTISTSSTFLSKTMAYIPVAVLAFISPVIPIIIAVGIAIFTDTVFGIWAVRKTNPKQFKSTVLRKGLVTKLFFYQTSVFTIYLIDKLILGEVLALFNSIPFIATKIVALALISIELVSINEKFEIVHNKSIIRGIKDFINSYNTIKKDLN